MQNFISTFSQVKWFQFMNEQLSREQGSPHRHDCHGPPHAPRVGRHGDKSPPPRSAAVARSDPWKTPPAQVGFCQHATRRRRLPWVVGSDLCKNNSRTKVCISHRLIGRSYSRLKNMLSVFPCSACQFVFIFLEYCILDFHLNFLHALDSALSHSRSNKT